MGWVRFAGLVIMLVLLGFGAADAASLTFDITVSDITDTTSTGYEVDLVNTNNAPATFDAQDFIFSAHSNALTTGQGTLDFNTTLACPSGPNVSGTNNFTGAPPGASFTATITDPNTSTPDVITFQVFNLNTLQPLSTSNSTTLQNGDVVEQYTIEPNGEPNATETFTVTDDGKTSTFVFHATAVPEPSMWWVLGLGGAYLLLRLRSAA